ncbi:MAG: LLM class F420-dependent oxidoreductase [Microbacteriaceae bacterium]|nr:LLM class F420-dependent oxidoreductase [Microbacteriaceae bacterium]
MRFGMFVPQGWRHDLVNIDPAKHWEVMNGIAQHADSNELWESVWVYDHFHTVPIPSDQATHEAWSLISGFAASTKRVRLGQMCTCMSYRNPAYLAKAATTADIISGGRVEMGIGGGWYEHEWRAYGYGFPGIGERLGRLREGVEIMKQAWTTGTATLDGKHYQVDNALFYPQPLQKPGIPFWISGGGEQNTLKIAAEYAQYTNFGGDPETFARKSEILKQHCDKAGTDFDAIVRSTNFNVMIGDSQADIDRQIDALEARVRPYLGDATDGFLSEYRSPGALAVGTPEQIVERLAKQAEAGLGYTIFYFPDAAYSLEAVQRLEEEVLPHLA